MMLFDRVHAVSRSWKGTVQRRRRMGESTGGGGAGRAFSCCPSGLNSERKQVGCGFGNSVTWEISGGGLLNPGKNTAFVFKGGIAPGVVQGFTPWRLLQFI
ncbi:hypothetical protein KC19_1G083000 [Ceratodon purpureus]|uniref:Uncharacterized protein n=1 Tax=Ceratodon purpureus TaxID=3225 RepID=A0A8T0J5B1_CERPU|nr:hypothetical protein KC19_1G083000 [Ceratodon purpureus]